MFFTRGKIRLRSRRKYCRRGCVCFQARRCPRGGLVCLLFLAENNGAQSETTPIALAFTYVWNLVARVQPVPSSICLPAALLSKLLRYSYVVDERWVSVSTSPRLRGGGKVVVWTSRTNFKDNLGERGPRGLIPSSREERSFREHFVCKNWVFNRVFFRGSSNFRLFQICTFFFFFVIR